MEVGSDASVSLRTVVEIGEGTAVQQSEVIFRLADGVWKRVNSQPLASRLIYGYLMCRLSKE